MYSNEFSTHPERDEESRVRYGQSTAERVQSKIAAQLRSAAGNLRSGVAPWEEEQGPAFKREAARWLDKAADCVDAVNLQQIESDVKHQVRSNPGRSLLIAGAVGLLV